MSSDDFSTHGIDDADSSLASFYRNHPRPNEIPRSVAITVVLAQTPEFAVWVSGAAIHSTGVRFSVRTAIRDAAETSRHAYPGDGFFGVELSDGTAISSQSWDLEPGLSSQGGGGNSEGWRAEYFLHPIPPDGLTRFYFLQPSLNIPECSAEFDILGWRDLGATVTPLWPLVAPIEHTDPPRVSLPEDSWFQQFLNE